ncbi:uncharacterized protein [Nicotiana tomentosiformis]|uniref:uncharacterized protein n=1 Tax=Nicotiana tomentosiformis TaxID=4098 RepID=UPI00388CA8B1
MGQLASSQNIRSARALPSDTKPNPKAQVNAVILRNGRVLEEAPKKKKYTARPKGELVPKPVEETEKESEGSKPVIVTRPPPPFTQRYSEPSACEFAVGGNFASILYPKLKDPGSFTIPLFLGKQEVGRALCDLGASRNLVPSRLFKQLELVVLRPTTITLQLTDRSLVMTEGIIEHVLVRVEKFILHAEFIVLDYEVDEEVPIILGRPFLSTGGVIIDVREGKLKMRVDNEEITFNVIEGIKQSPYVNSDPDEETELEEMVLQAECVKMIQKRARDERGDLPRTCKKARLNGRKKK